MNNLRYECIPLEDLPWLQELAKTHSVLEMAEKWGVHRSTITNFLMRHGKGAAQIKKEYRMDFIRNYQPKDARSVYVYAEKFNVTVNRAYELMRLAKEQL